MPRTSLHSSVILQSSYSDYPPSAYHEKRVHGTPVKNNSLLDKYYDSTPSIAQSSIVEEVYDLNPEYDKKTDSFDGSNYFKENVNSPPSTTAATSEVGIAEGNFTRSNAALPFRRRKGSQVVGDKRAALAESLAKMEGASNVNNGVRHPHNNGSSTCDENNNFRGHEENRTKGDTSHAQKSAYDKTSHSTWNKLNTALFVGHALLSAATSVPITLVPTMARCLEGISEDERSNNASYYTNSGNTAYDIDSTSTTTLEVYDESGTRKRWIPFRIRTRNSGITNNSNSNQFLYSPSSFASHLVAVVTLATAFGKFINGPLVDIVGARRLLIVYGLCTCFALVGLRYSYTPTGAIICCSGVEFFSSVLWPSGTVILGAHYGTILGKDRVDGEGSNRSDGRFERGIYVTSLASRCGSLLAMPLSSMLLKWTDLVWRDVALLAALAALSGVIVFYFFLTDSPGKLHDPQNPIVRSIPQSSNNSGGAFHGTYQPWVPPSLTSRTLVFFSSVLSTILPSLRIVVVSRVFWVVAAAHAGATMVKSSERILGTYYRDTSNGVVPESKAGAMTVFLSMGMLGGLLFGGRAFALAADGERGRENNGAAENSISIKKQGESLMIDATQLRPKNMIAFFYCLSICMCYMLAFFAMPFVRRALHLPVLVLVLQVLATICLGAGVAVQYYHIPAIVGATFGKNRGLYTAYTDGVAALVSSMVWRIVGGAVEEGNPQGGGWAYGWAAVALLLILCGTLMVGIMEVYFVGGGWRHHDDRQPEGSFPTELPQDLNGSWMEDEILYTGLTIEDSSIRHGGIHILSDSALQFLSPGRIRRREMTVLATVDSDEDDAMKIDLLGIDDDGSVLYPSANPGGGSNRNDTAHTELLDFAPITSNPSDNSQPLVPIELNNVRGDVLCDTMVHHDDSDYVSFNHMIVSKSSDENRIRESSTFDDPRSDYYTDVAQTTPLDTFGL